MTVTLRSIQWSRPGSIALLLACSACPGDDVPSIPSTESDTGTTDATTTGITTLEPDSSGGSTSSSGDASETGLDTTAGTTDAETTAGTTDGETTAGTTDGETTAGTTDGETTAGTTDGESTTGGAICGDGMAEDGEECDAKDLGGETCASQGFTGGVLLCADDCTLDTSSCTSQTCGNAVLEGTEECDGADLGGETCVTQGFSMGVLACANDCTLDTSGCSNPMCGNDVIEMGEVCDGADLAGETCVTQGTAGGALACLADCSGYDISGCACEEEDIGGAMGPAVASGSTVGDDDDFAGSCGGSSGNDRVIRFTAPFDGDFAFNTFGSSYDTKLSLLSDCATEIACNDDSTGVLQSQLQLAMVAGQSVLIVIDGFNGATGDWVLNISEPAVCGDGVVTIPEVCDGANLGGESCATQGFTNGALGCAVNCINFDVSGCFDGPPCADEDLGTATGPAVASGNTAADDDDLAPSCGGVSGNDHVMLFSSVGAGIYTFDTLGSGYDTKLALYSDCATQTSCNDDSGGTAQSSLQLDMLAGQQVLVAVDGFDGANGDWVLNITPPAGGLACQEQDIGSALGNGVAGGSTVASDNDLDPSCSSGDANDEVIHWVAPAAGQYTFNTNGSTYDTVLALFSDCTTQLACDDDAGTGLQSLITRNMAAGEVVLILVDGYNGATGDWTLNITSP